MSLPISMDTPQYIITIPSTKEKVAFRPFVTREQKSLMLALATENNDNIINAIKNIIEICSYGKVKASKLAAFDIEYLFLQLRGKSVSESVSLVGECNHCQQEIPFKFDITIIEPDFSIAVDKKIQLTENIGCIMKYPTIEHMVALRDNYSELLTIEIATECIEGVWQGDNYIEAKDYTTDDMIEFVDGLTAMQLEKLTTFVTNSPYMHKELNMTCPHCKGVTNFSIRGLENFFG